MPGADMYVACEAPWVIVGKGIIHYNFYDEYYPSGTS